MLGLAVFSSAEDDNDIATTTIRHSILVSPQLSIRSAVRNAKAGAREYLVGLEIANASSSIVSINIIAPISTFWSGDTLGGSARLFPNQAYRTQHRIKAVQNDRNTSQRGVIESQRGVIDGLSKLLQGQSEINPSAYSKSIDFTTGVMSDNLYPYLSSLRDARLVFLQQSFPTIPLATLFKLFPLLDPLDLDFAVSWTIEDGDTLRSGVSVLHGVRLGPEFSLVEGIRRDIDAAIASGGKTTRTMYEETGRLRQVLMDSVLEGVLSRENDPVEVVVGTSSGRRVEVDVKDGSVVPVLFTLRNRSPALPVRWMLELSETDV